MSNGLADALGRILGDTLRTGLRTLLRDASRSSNRSRFGRPSAPRQGRQRTPSASGYPGDYRGMPPVSYSPVPGERPDPGEVVWTWVPFEEDHSRGKDRPVLLVGRDDAWLLALQMTSVDHDLDADQEARAGRFWVDIGAGAWDGQGRRSEVRVNRVIRVDPDAVRRVSVSVSAEVFEVVVAGMRRHLA